MNSIAKKWEGMYRRYSDDYILIIPNVDLNFNKENITIEIKNIADELKINIHEEKGSELFYDGTEMIDYDTDKRSKLDYLGFVFDGENVKMRLKSPNKFYSKAKKMIKKAHYKKRNNKLAKLAYRRQIYGLYTDLGADRGKYGNFIKYAKNSKETFDKQSPLTNNFMMDQISNRKKKVEKMLGYRIHT